jgi:exonuclease III
MMTNREETQSPEATDQPISNSPEPNAEEQKSRQERRRAEKKTTRKDGRDKAHGKETQHTCGVCEEDTEVKTRIRCTQCMQYIHKRYECSRLKKSRRKKAIQNKLWKCINCKDPTKKHGMIRSCGMCGRCIKNGVDCLKCNECNKSIHKQHRCSDLQPTEQKRINRLNWRCKGCIEKEEESEERRKQTQQPEIPIEYMYQRKNPNKSTKPIITMQWNADSLKTKKEELKEFLNKYNIDIFLIQETKMLETDKIPDFPGYTILSKPRKQFPGNHMNRGGGLLIGIRNKLPYREIKNMELRDKEDALTESQTIEIPIKEGETWRITNIYIPSERTGDIRGSTKETIVTTKHWPKGINDMIAGDINAHAARWDKQMDRAENHRGLEKKRGEMIVEWLMENDMDTINSRGQTTHVDRKTKRNSSPDVTIINTQQKENYNWQLTEKLSSSDHKPILITRYISDGICLVNTKEKYKWNLEKGDMAAYRDKIESEIPKTYEGKELIKLERIWNKTLIKAARQKIPKKKSNIQSKPALSKEVKEEMKLRDKYPQAGRNGLNNVQK